MYETLEKCIDKSGLKRGYIANQLGITYVNLYQKLQGQSKFSFEQMMALKQVLHPSASEWRQIEQEIKND